MPTADPPPWLPDLLNLASWPRPTDVSFTVAIDFNHAEVQYALSLADRPADTIVVRVIPDTPTALAHGNLDRIVTHLRAGAGGVPEIDCPCPVCVTVDRAGERFEAGLAEAVARGGTKAGDDEDGDGCAGR